MELFFISSPIGILQVLIKRNQLYSLSQTQKKFKSKKLGYKNILNKRFSFLTEENSLCFLKRKKRSALAKNIDQQLTMYFNRKLKKFKVPLYERGTDFQKTVWKSLQKIHWGSTKNYSQIARELKKPKAYRAVGNACAKNPFLIVVPCHRVLSQSGAGGFAIGLKAKKQLIDLESECR